MGTKTFCIGWVDVRHEDSSDVEGIFFKIIEQTDGVQKGAVIDLSTKSNGDTFLVKVALPDVVKDCLGFHGVTGDKDCEQLLVNLSDASLRTRVLRLL